MRTYSTNEARNNFSEIIDHSRREPVAITKRGRVMSVILAKEDYERYQEIEDNWWMNYKTTPSQNIKDDVDSRIEKLELKLKDVSNNLA